MVFERLAKYHDREQFTCGVESLDVYLRRYARQDVRKKVAAVFVLVPERRSPIVLGYYTLSATSIDAGDLPSAFLRKMPRYHYLPATLIGRLAASLKHRTQGFRLGEKLLVNALRRCVETSEIIGSVAVVVDAINEEAMAFYRRYGFASLTGHPRRLFIPMKSISDHLRSQE